MSRATNLLIALTVASGVYVLASESWSAAYRLNLLIHPLLGLAATGILIGYAAKHLRDKLKSQIQVGARGLAVFLLLPALGIALGEAFGASPQLRWLPVLAVVAFLIKPLRGMLQFLVGRLRHVPSIVLGSLALLSWAVALATGATLFPWHAMPAAHDALILHRTLALVAGGLYVGHVLFVQAYRVERRDAPSAQESRRELRFATTAVGACALALVGIVSYEHLSHVLPKSTLLGRIPGPGHPMPPASPYTGIDRAAVSVTRSCAADGCHPTIVDDFEHSNHLRSPRTPHFQRTTALLESERGAGDTLVCAGCHYPLAAATDQPEFRRYATEPGFGCVNCHAIREVSLDEGPARSSYVLDPPLDHLRMFVTADGREEPSALSLAMIRMNPIGHGRALRTSLVGENELCLSCHHNEIHPTNDKSFEHPRCTSCHMEPQGMLGRAGGATHNHLFPASNTAVPFLLADAETGETLRQFLTGEKPLYLDNWGSAWVLREKGDVGQHQALWLRSAADLVGDVKPGSTVELRINTTNAGIEHHFPAAPLDLIDVWLDVELTDAAGRVLLRSGTVDDRGYVDSTAHRLGGYVLDTSGKRLEFHRIWDVADEKIERHIALSESTVDTYPVTIPADVARGNLELRARWNYRKLTQQFVDWAYGGGAEPPPHMPITAIGRIDAHWPVGGETAAPAAYPSPPSDTRTPPAQTAQRSSDPASERTGDES